METRPPTLPWPVVGHDWAVDLLNRAVSAGRPPHALLITGPPNVGKGTLARSLARALLCTADPRPCDASSPCRACRLTIHGSHPDLYWIEPQAGSLRIDQVRSLTRQLALSPFEGAWQIAVLDQFELATDGAANALLKTLEEPPPNVILVLLAQHAEVLLPTITSRCQIIALRPIPRPVIQSALIERWRVNTERAKLLSHICGGRIGWAISAATSPNVLEYRTQTLDDWVRLLHRNRVDRFAYAESLARQAPELIVSTLELWIGWWRDVLLLTCNSAGALTNIDRQNELSQIATWCDMTLAQATLTALLTALDRLSRHANTRLVLEILLLDLPFL